MAERPSPFEKGVIVKLSCPRGFRGSISLLGLKEMNPIDRDDYITLSKQTCQKCSLNKNRMCMRIGGDPLVETMAFADTMKEDGLPTTMIEYQALCAPYITKIIKY